MPHILVRLATIAPIVLLASTASSAPHGNIPIKGVRPWGDYHPNSGNYTSCPSYESIQDAQSLEGFEEESFQGEWYGLVTNGKLHISYSFFFF